MEISGLKKSAVLRKTRLTRKNTGIKRNRKRRRKQNESSIKNMSCPVIFILTAYVFGAFLLVFVGIGSMLYNIQQAVANFEYVLGFISLIFVGLVPIPTMRVLAEERKQRTDQLLYSLPITTTDIILGNILRF